MAITNKFKIHAENGSSDVNLYTNDAYELDSERLAGSMSGTTIKSKLINTGLREATLITCALIGSLASKNSSATGTLGPNSSLSDLSTFITNSFNAWMKATKVDNAIDADTLGGVDASSYLLSSDISELESLVNTLNSYFTNSKANNAINSDTLEGHNASYFTSASDFSDFASETNDSISNLSGDIADVGNSIKNGVLSIYQNSTLLGSFSANSDTNTNININVPEREKYYMHNIHVKVNGVLGPNIEDPECDVKIISRDNQSIGSSIFMSRLGYLTTNFTFGTQAATQAERCIFEFEPSLLGLGSMTISEIDFNNRVSIQGDDSRIVITDVVREIAYLIL